MSDVMWKEPVAKGTAIIKQNDLQAFSCGEEETRPCTSLKRFLQADYFYIVKSGSFSISKAEDVKEGQSFVAATGDGGNELCQCTACHTLRSQPQMLV